MLSHYHQVFYKVLPDSNPFPCPALSVAPLFNSEDVKAGIVVKDIPRIEPLSSVEIIDPPHPTRRSTDNDYILPTSEKILLKPSLSKLGRSSSNHGRWWQFHINRFFSIKVFGEKSKGFL